MLENMNDNVKLDIAIEIMSTKIANAMNKGTRQEVEQLLEERKQLYLGNWDVINKILEVYSKDVKRGE